jgi:hypothetical protein
MGGVPGTFSRRKVSQAPSPRSVEDSRKGASLGVPGLTMCRDDLPAARRLPHIVRPGSHGERNPVCCPGSEGGRRRPRRPGMRVQLPVAVSIGNGIGIDQGTRKSASIGCAGFDIVPHRPPGTAEPPAQCHTGLPREARCGLLSRLRGRPPARHRRGRSPSSVLLSTTPMVRRWAAGGGPEGRGCGKPGQGQGQGQQTVPRSPAVDPCR